MFWYGMSKIRAPICVILCAVLLGGLHSICIAAFQSLRCKQEAPESQDLFTGDSYAPQYQTEKGFYATATLYLSEWIANKWMSMKTETGSGAMHRALSGASTTKVSPLFSAEELKSTLVPETFDLASFNSHTCGIIENQTTAHSGHRNNHALVSTTSRIRKFRIIISISNEFADVFMNWLVFYFDNCPSTAHLYIICLDAAIEKQLPRFGLSCSHVFHMVTVRRGKSRLWLERMRVTRSLLDQGFDVLLSDTDAVWLRNPFPLLERYPASHVISSRASFPSDVDRLLGATLCMGFVYIKAAPTTQLIWKQIVESMESQKGPDDQRTVNRMFSQHGLSYTRKPHTIAAYESNHGRFLHSNGTMLGVTLLPSHLVKRTCDPNHLLEIYRSVVAHCFVRDMKENAERSFGTWALKPWWRSVAFDPTLGMSHYVREVSFARVDKVYSSILENLIRMGAVPAGNFSSIDESEAKITGNLRGSRSIVSITETARGAVSTAPRAVSKVLNFTGYDAASSAIYSVNGSYGGPLSLFVADRDGENRSVYYHLWYERGARGFKVLV